MRAAVLHEYGVPTPGEFEDLEPGPGQAVVEVLAAGVNPVDVSICAGRFYAGKPPLPSVAGREGVGMLNGERVYFDAPISPFGSMAERVLVLAASGVLGQIAVQAAKLLGAGRVVAAARSREGLERCVELGADATVRLDEPDLPAALQRAADGRIDVVLDPLFGAPFAAAVNAASFGARIVQIGQGAGAEATIASAAIRGKLLTILGHSNGAAPPEIKREAYARMADAVARGELTVEVERLPLEQVQEAWRRLQEGAHRKIVLVR
jgi:NADPH2:quinone reductase